jgi:hypothetical protein
MGAEKLIRDGKVAILISEDSRWSTALSSFDHKEKETMLFNKDLVSIVLGESNKDLKETLYSLIGKDKAWKFENETINLNVVWLEIGTLFKIDGDNGFEELDIYHSNSYIKA